MSLVERGSPWTELATLPPSAYSIPSASNARATRKAISRSSKGVLTGLNRRIERNKDIAMLSIEDAESLQQALQAARSNA